MSIAAAKLSDFSEHSKDDRVHALHDFGILDTPLERSFDDVTRIAAAALETPIAVISLLAENRAWFKSEIGLGCRETPLEISVCSHAVREDELLDIPDLRLDVRTSSNPLVTGEPHLRFYAGAVLRTSAGIPLGTVCVLDHKPRHLTDGQRHVLLGLARLTMDQLELRRLSRQSNAIMESQADTMARAGHDLKSPLQTISTALDLATLDPSSHRTHQALGAGRRAVVQLAADLDNLAKDAADSLNGALNLSPTSFAINDLFDLMAPAWRLQAGRKGLHIDIVKSRMHVTCDRRLLRSVLANLVGNAIKYTDRGRVLVGCRRRPNGIEIAVLDTGRGISAEAQKDVFNVFVQGDPASEGMGLGMTLVRHATVLMRGSLVVRSVLGTGSYFAISLPTG